VPQLPEDECRVLESRVEEAGRDSTGSLVERLNKMADSLYHMAGAIASLSRCPKTSVEAGCECLGCSALKRTHECINEMERMVKDVGAR
jgi:hypothetical protein